MVLRWLLVSKSLINSCYLLEQVLPNKQNSTCTGISVCEVQNNDRY